MKEFLQMLVAKLEGVVSEVKAALAALDGTPSGNGPSLYERAVIANGGPEAWIRLTPEEQDAQIEAQRLVAETVGFGEDADPNRLKDIANQRREDHIAKQNVLSAGEPAPAKGEPSAPVDSTQDPIGIGPG